MQKIISLFARNYDGDRLVRDELVPGAEWVAAGEGVATRKWDGTCCLVRDGKLYKRFDAKGGKTPPPDFEPAQEPDPVTGHWPGWVPVKTDNPADRWHIEAWGEGKPYADGTYELVGPKVQGNPELTDAFRAPLDHHLFMHGDLILDNAPRDFESIKQYLTDHIMEGIVWHHPDGRMVKIKAKDFGLKWPR